MIRTYALAIETDNGIKPLPYGPLTLVQAESWQNRLAAYGKTVLVVNVNAI